MVARLAVADANVTELAGPYAVSVQAVSKHLRVLQDAGLVTRGRDAQRRQAEERDRRLDAVLAALPDDHDPTVDPTNQAGAPT